MKKQLIAFIIWNSYRMEAPDLFSDKRFD